MKRCPTCNEWQASFLHKCKPRWLVLEEEYHGSLTDWDIATPVRAFGPAEAATQYVADRDSEECDYTVANGEPVVVRVKPDFETALVVKEFTVRGEWDPTYTAEETKPQPLLGFHVSIDSSIPQGEIHMIDHTGRVVSRITGLGEPDPDSRRFRPGESES